MNTHYCDLHNSKFYKNERKDVNGEIKTWFSHKMLDGKGFCVEKVYDGARQMISQRSLTINGVQPKGMLACNAMNNAVSLAANGRIEIDQIESYYKKILTELTSSL
jgi:hypothetical protein